MTPAITGGDGIVGLLGRGVFGPHTWIEALCDLVLKWRPSFWAEEQGQITSGVGPFLQQRAMQRRAYVAREQFPSRRDKAVRAQSIRGRMAGRGLYVRQGAPWMADLLAELLSFPVAKHDDQVDALGLVGQLLDKIQPGQRRELSIEVKPEPYQPPCDDTSDSSFKLL